MVQEKQHQKNIAEGKQANIKVMAATPIRHAFIFRGFIPGLFLRKNVSDASSAVVVNMRLVPVV